MSHAAFCLATLPGSGQGMLRIPVETTTARAASAWVEVDLGAIAHNVRVFRAVLPPACRLIAVVKADGYGHGMVRVARTALAAGADELAVANVHEGALLRVAGVTAPILIAGPVPPDSAGDVVQHGLTASLGCFELAAALARVTRRFLPVQIEVDTGMARHGIPARDLGAFVDTLRDRGRLSIAGVYTHLVGLGPDDLPAIRQQLATFVQCTESTPALRGVRRHVCNTLGALLLPRAGLAAAWLDGVRIGGGLYGFDPLRGVGAGARAVLGAALRPALSLKTTIAGLRDAAAGDPVGYGGNFVCDRPTRLALLPIGYADGLLRELWTGADVLVRGRRAPLVGRISMNQAVVDVSDLPGVVFGEEVVLIGAMGHERIAAEERVPPGGSVYEVTSLLPARLPRRYVGAGGGGERAEHPRTGRGRPAPGSPDRGGVPGEQLHGPRR